MIFERNCPLCRKVLTYKTERGRDRQEKYNRPCRTCNQTGPGNSFYGKRHSQEHKQAQSLRQTDKKNPKISAAHQGTNNPMHGRHFYDVWVEKYGKEVADQKMNDFRAGCSARYSGVGNPNYGKPLAQGSGNGWKGWYKGWYFRSLRELAYALQLDKQGRKWVSAEGTGLRIKYTTETGNQRTYVADFLVEDICLVEVKPQHLHDYPFVMAKRDAALEFCSQKGLVYQLLDPGKIDKEELKKLHDTGVVRFMDRYEKRYLELQLPTSAGE